MYIPQEKYSTKKELVQVKSKVLRQKVNYLGKLSNFYDGRIPNYVLAGCKSYIKIRVSDWRGEQHLRITPKDVVDYYHDWAGNIISGCRVIAGYAGDWRPIDRLAKECLEWFKFVNIEALRRKGRKYAITLKK